MRFDLYDKITETKHLRISVTLHEVLKIKSFSTKKQQMKVEKSMLYKSIENELIIGY